MNTYRITAIALLSAVLLAGCGNSSTTPAADPANEPKSFIGKAVKEATDGAMDELATKNVDLDVKGQPKAEITPAGDFLIGGKAVTVNAEQRDLLLEYRQHWNKVAEAGIGIGVEGADLAGKALTEAIKGIFSGDTDNIDKKIEGHAEGIKQSAQKLCDLLPAMKVSQDKLAAVLPEFKPYANMDDGDVENCMTDNDSHIAGKDFGSDIGRDIGRDVRKAIKDETAGNDGMNAAEEAEAASARQ